MVINEPYNLGVVVMSRDTQIALVELCKTHGITILSNEVFRLLEHGPSNDRILAMVEAYLCGGISCVSMSNPWGAYGITVGWLVCSDPSKIQALWDRQYFGIACVGRACELLWCCRPRSESWRNTGLQIY